MYSRIKSFLACYTNKFWYLIIAILTMLVLFTIVFHNNASIEAFSAVYVIALLAITCLWLVQPNLKHNLTNFELLFGYFMRGYKDGLTTKSENNNKAVIALLWGGILAMASFMLFSSLSMDNIFIRIIFLITFVFILLLVGITTKTSVTNKKHSIIVATGISLPIAFHLLMGGYGSQTSTFSLVWMFAALFQALFTFDSKRSKKFFTVFTVLILADLMAEIILFKDVDYLRVFFSAATMISLGFGMFTAIQIYILYSNDNYNRTLTMLTELKNAQSSLVQKEKAIVLGQLISGVAHEINTPIGAIKASSETMSASFETSMRSVMEGSGDFTEEDYDIFFMFVRLTIESLREMKSTAVLRRAKMEVRKYFEEIDMPYGGEIIDRLSRLEICEINMVKSNMVILRNPKICDILSRVCSLSNIIVGMETITIATGKVSKIVFALKSYSHTNISDEHVQLDVVKTIETVLILYHNQIKSSVEVVRDYDENLPFITGNSDELSQVWTNLIQNALYAMDNAGTLTISIHTDSDAFGAKIISISVTDTGKGIKPEYINSIFDPFFTTKPLGEGSGLGLDISRKIIAQHGGSLNVKSEEGKGSTFTVILPVSLQDTDSNRL